MIYTSYFAVQHRLPEDLRPVSIARFTPHAFRGMIVLPLSPTWSILSEYKTAINDPCAETIYTERFCKEILDKLNPHDVVKKLGDNPVLLCYEKPRKFCHRHIVADWLRTAGYKVEEYVFDS